MLNIRKWMVKVTQTLAEIKHTTYIPGQIMMYAGPIVQSVSNNVITTTAPTGYLLCDGSIVLVADYPELAAALGSTYGGDGTTTFGLPDFRGRTGVGVGTGTSSTATEHTLGQTAGSETHTLTEAQLPSVSGAFRIRRLRTSGGTDVSLMINPSGHFTSNGTEGTANGYTTTTAISELGATEYQFSFGSGSSHNIMQPYVGINYIIATGKTN